MPAPDLLRRRFAAPALDLPWTADITHVRADKGFLHLAFVRNARSRSVLVCPMAEHLRTKLVIDALEMAVWQRKIELLHHHRLPTSEAARTAIFEYLEASLQPQASALLARIPKPAELRTG